MTLPLPKAGTNPGRAGQLTPIEPGSAGENLSSLGDMMFRVGTGLMKEKLDLELKQAEVDLTRDMNDLRLQIEQIGDPDQSEATWEAGVQNLRAQYVGENAEGGGRLNERNIEKFNLRFDALANRIDFQLGARHIGMRNAQREATYINYAHEAARAAAEANDPKTDEILLAQGDEQIDGLLARGVIDAAEAERRKIGLRADISNAKAIKRIENDPAGFLADAEAGGYAGLEADTLERYKAQAQGYLDAEQKRAAKEAEQAEQKRNKAIGDRLGEMRNIFGNEREAVDEAWLADPEVKQHEDYPETMAALSLRNEKQDWAAMSPEELDGYIEQERGRKVAHEYQTERLQILEDFREKHADGYRSDPIGYRAEAVGDIDPLPFETATSEPGDFIKALQWRTQQSQSLIERGFTDERRILSDDERAQLREMAGQTRDPAERAKLAGALAAGLDPKTSDHLAGVIDDPVFTHMGGFLAAGGSRRTAEEAFRGQQVIAEGNAILPPVRERTSAAHQTIDAYFAQVPGGEKLQSSIVAAADAIYAARVRHIDPTQEIDVGVYRQSLHEAMGGTGSYDSYRAAKGGMQEVRGALTVLDPGIGARDVDEALTRLQGAMEGRRAAKYAGAVDRAIDTAAKTQGGLVQPITRYTPEEARARANAVWQSASQSGGQPGIEGQPLEPDALEDMSLRSIGRDSYQLVDEKGGLVEDLMTGEPYTFSLKKIIREFGR